MGIIVRLPTLYCNPPHIMGDSCAFFVFYLPFSVFWNRPKNIKQAAQCNLVGKVVRFIPNEEARTLMSNRLGDEIWQHTWQKVFRVMVNGKVYF